MSRGQCFKTHYHFAQLSISTGNLHLAAARVCRGNRNQTPARAVLSNSTTATKQSGVSKQRSENLSLRSKEKVWAVKSGRYYDSQAAGTNITLALIASIIADIWDGNHALNGITKTMTAFWICHFL